MVLCLVTLPDLRRRRADLAATADFLAQKILLIFLEIGPSEITLRVIMRPSSLGGGRILRRTLSLRLSVCPCVGPSRYCYRASRGAI